MVSLLGLLLWREPCPAQRRCGLSLIALATATLLLSGEPGLWQGQVCFLGAALLWALFTLAVRHSGLTALDAAALVAVPSALLLLPTLLWSPLPTVGHASIWLWQGLLQGIGAGLLAALCYAHAIRTLGAEVSSALGSLTPVMAAMLAWWLLGRPSPSRYGWRWASCVSALCWPVCQYGADQGGQYQLRNQRRSKRPRRPQSSSQLLSNTRSRAGLA